MSRAVTLRGASASEAALLTAIQEAACVAALPHIFPPEQFPFPRAGVLDAWRAFDGAVRVAEVGGAPAGFCAVVAPTLQSLYVLPAHWGTGVADALLADAVSRIAASGAREAHLWALEGNARARRFYEKRGWRLDGRARVVEFPPHPTDVGYTLDLGRTHAA